MLVDDDDRNILALAATLKPMGPNIITARDGTDCLEKIRQNAEINLVLLDMMMPVMDGYETLKILRAHAETETLPVIAVTALTMHGDRERCLEAGANCFCPKPVNIDELLDQIRELLVRDK